MLRTIVLGNYTSVQGHFVRSLPNGRIIVRVDGRDFEGDPIEKKVA